MKKIIITKGLPGSGKSTWAKQMLATHPHVYKRINKDDLRAMFDDNLWSPKNEQFVLNARNMLVESALKAGKHVIIDDTNLHPKHELQLRELAKNYNQQNNDSVIVEVVFFDVPVEECIKRDLKRSNSVGERIIREQYERFLKPQIVSSKWAQNEELPKCFLVDIDGTIAIKGNRSAYDWLRVGEDTPKWSVINVVKSLKKADFNIIFISGRDAVCRELTSEWICRYFEWQTSDFELYMRNENDTRKDSIVKLELFDEHIKERYFVEAVIDDRQQVVDMWRNELGLTCLQVDYGNF